MDSLYSVEEVYRKVVDLLSKGKRVALASVIGAQGSTPRGTSAKMIVTADGHVYGTVGGGCVENYVVHEAEKVLEDRQLRVVDVYLGDDSWSGAGMACGGKITVAIELVEPKPKLIILGAGHVAKALTKMGQTIGFSITVLDPFAKAEDFPEADIVVEGDYVKGLRNIPLYEHDNVVILTRHHADEDTLRAVVNSEAGYIGMIGSKNRVGQVYEELIREGMPAEKLLKVHAPVGLDIGAETPEEIALSILAEILMIRKRGTGTSMALKSLEDPQVKTQAKQPNHNPR